MIRYSLCKLSMYKSLSIIISTGLVIGIGMVFFAPTIRNEKSIDSKPGKNVEIRNGIQYITIEARRGYFPKQTIAQANMPTTLVVETDGTYDCSTALVLPSIGYKKLLPTKGEEIIDLGSPSTGTLQGLCSMGMYSFTILFTESPSEKSFGE